MSTPAAIRIANRLFNASTFDSWVNVTGTGRLTFTVAASEGQIPSGSSVQVGSFTTQTDVKQTWADGSLKHAVVSCDATSFGMQSLTVIANPGGSYTPTWPSASVEFVVTAGAGTGNTYTATLPAFDGTDTWLNGAVCRDARVRVTPKTAGNVSHDNLSVIFDMRSFAAGGHRVDVTVENCRDNANMDQATYNLTVTVAGSSVLTKTAFKHFSFTAWRKVFWTSASEATATLDFEPFYASRALPRIESYITINPNYNNPDSDGRYVGNTTYFDLLRFGFMDPKINNGGGRPELGLLSGWDIAFLVNQDPAQREAILRHGEYLASWSLGRCNRNDDTMYRADDTTEGLITFQAFTPNYPSTLRAPIETVNGVTCHRGERDSNIGDGSNGYPSNEQLPRLNVEHPTCVPMVAYFVTGDRFYVEAAKHWANFPIFYMYAEPRIIEGGLHTGRNYNGAHAIVSSQGFVGTARSFSRPLRNLVHTLHMLPDSDPHRTYFLNCVNDNLTWMSYYMITGSPATGNVFTDAALWWQDNNNSAYDYWNEGKTVLEHHILYTQIWASVEAAWTIYWCKLKGVATVPAGALTFIDRIGAHYVAMLAPSDDTTFLRAFGIAAYYPPVAIRDGGLGATVNYITTLADYSKLCEEYDSITQAGFRYTDVTCSDSTTIHTPSRSFTSDWIGRNVVIGGRTGGNWLEITWDAAGAYRRNIPSRVYRVTNVVGGDLVLDQKPVTNGTTGTSGILESREYPVAPLNGGHSGLGVKLAVMRGLANSSAANTYAFTTYRDGGNNDLATLIRWNMDQVGYAFVVEALP